MHEQRTEDGEQRSAVASGHAPKSWPCNWPQCGCSVKFTDGDAEFCKGLFPEPAPAKPEDSDAR